MCRLFRFKKECMYEEDIKIYWTVNKYYYAYSICGVYRSFNKCQVVPVKYCIIAAVVLVILTAVTAFTQKWFVPGIITKIIAIIMIVVLIMGSIYLNQTRHMINKITTTQEEKIVMGVYVLNDSGYDSVDMLNNKSIGIGTAVDRESTDELIKRWVQVDLWRSIQSILI